MEEERLKPKVKAKTEERKIKGKRKNTIAKLNSKTDLYKNILN